MTTRSQDSIGADLAVALRQRAADVGGEEIVLRTVLAAAAATPQRRRFAPWSGSLGGRTILVLAGVLLATAAVAAAVGGSFDARPLPADYPTLRNGPILVAHEGRMWWIDPATGKTIVAEDLPDLPEGTDAAAWSRDGRRLAIVVRGDLELIDLRTGERRLIATCADIGWDCQVEVERTRSFDWSPDGITIAFTNDRRLGLIDVLTGRLTNVIEPDGGSFSSPSWSPDGRSIAFEYAVPHQGRSLGVLREIQAIEQDGSGRRRLSGSPEPESIGFASPIWSPDGTRIVYLGSDVWDESTGWALRVMSIDPVGGSQAPPPASLVQLGSAYCLGFCPSVTVSPDGSSVLIDDGDDLVMAQLDGTRSRSLGVNARPMAWRPVAQ